MKCIAPDKCFLSEKYFIYFSINKYVVGTHKKRLPTLRKFSRQIDAIFVIFHRE